MRPARAQPVRDEYRGAGGFSVRQFRKNMCRLRCAAGKPDGVSAGSRFPLPRGVIPALDRRPVVGSHFAGWLCHRQATVHHASAHGRQQERADPGEFARWKIFRDRGRADHRRASALEAHPLAVVGRNFEMRHRER